MQAKTKKEKLLSFLSNVKTVLVHCRKDPPWHHILWVCDQTLTTTTMNYTQPLSKLKFNLSPKVRSMPFASLNKQTRTWQNTWGAHKDLRVWSNTEIHRAAVIWISTSFNYRSFEPAKRMISKVLLVLPTSLWISSQNPTLLYNHWL